jgi:type I restriction enzyme S subunit
VIDSRYLYYFMRTVDLGPLSQATTVPSVRKSDVKEISVPVPMVDIQQKVVGEIEKQFTRLAAAAQALQGAQQKLRRYRASSINRALADLRCPTVPLKETVELITKGTTPTSLGFKYTHSGVRFVKVESLSNGRINHERCVSISVEADAALRRSRLQVGDVLFSIAGTLGRVAIVVDVDLPANTNQAVAIIRPTHSLNCRFLAIALTAPEVASAIGKLRRGVGLSNLNLAQIGDMTVKVPSLEVQLRFIEEVETRLSIIDNLDVHLKAEVKRVESLRQSILRGAFRGELSDEDVMHGGSLEH